MIDIAREQPAQRLRILPRAAAAKTMLQEFHAVDIREQRLGLADRIQVQVGRFVTAFPCMGECRRVALIGTRFVIAQRASQRLTHEDEVAVLAEDERDDDPVVRRAARTIGTHEAIETTGLPFRHIGGTPGVVLLLACKGIGFVCDIALRQQRTGSDCVPCSAHGHAIHGDSITRGEVTCGELLLGWDGIL